MGELRHHEHKPRQWTIDEHEKLFALRKAGHTIKSISLELNRPQSSVSGRLKNTDDDGRFISHRERLPLADLGVDDELLKMHSEGWSIEKIALSIGFKHSAISNRLRKLLAKEGFPTTEQPDRKKRLCITCRKMFSSDSWEHRRCCDCRRNMQRSEVFSEEWSRSMSDKLKPCPFCGSETSPYAVRFQDSEESDLLKSAIDWLRKESVMLGNLLAVIHRDRGQYVRGVGVAQACIDAEVIVAGMNEQIEAVDELMQQAALAEREECADLCEDAFNKWDSKETDTWNCGVLYYSGLIRASSRR